MCCLQRLRPGAGAKDAPIAVLVKLRTSTRGHGFKPTSHDGEFDFVTAKRVNDRSMAGAEDTMDTLSI
eukprot:2542617-Pyramimonas_sp.AAC.1